MHPTAPESPRDRHRFHVLAAASSALAIVSLALVVYHDGWGAFGRVFAVAGSAQVAGKWVIFLGAMKDNSSGFGPWQLTYIIFVLDLVLSLILNSFLPQFEKVPRLGGWLIRTRERAAVAFAEYPKLRRMAWSGVALWVFLPLPASGAVTGSFASRLVGLSRTGAVAAIAVGSLATGVIFAIMAQALGANSQALLHNWKVTAASTVVFLALVWWGWRRLVKTLREDR